MQIAVPDGPGENEPCRRQGDGRNQGRGIRVDSHGVKKRNEIARSLGSSNYRSRNRADTA